MDPRDQVLQAVTPTVMVPRFGAFESLETNGHRFLVAADGLWLEAKRPWLYLRRRIASQSSVAMPYGTATPELRFEFRIPRGLVDVFVVEAKHRSPNECAAWITWREDTGALRLRMLEEVSAGPEHVEVIRPVLDEGEHLVVDLHSHGHFDAFFSSTDNRDDRGEFKLAGVVGSLHGEPTHAFRLCAGGLFINIPYGSAKHGRMPLVEDLGADLDGRELEWLLMEDYDGALA